MKKAVSMIRSMGFIALVLSLSSCKQDASNKSGKEDSQVETQSIRTIALQATSLGLNDSLSMPLDLSLAGPLLIVSNKQSSKYCLLLDLNSKKIINRFGIEGKGPGELLSVDQIDASRPGEIWVSDLTLQKFVRFEIDKIKTQSNYRPEKYIRLEGDSVLPMACKWAGEEMLTMNLGMGGRMLFYNSQGKLQRMVGKFPPKKSQDEPGTINAQAYMGPSAINLERKRVALGTSYSDRLDIVDFDGKEIASWRGSEKIEPEYQVYDVSGNAVFGPDVEKMKMGYIDIASTDKYIYALYSGKNFLANPLYGKTIYVYDWSGKPVATWVRYKVVFQLEK